ncbi:PH domain-containing protein [Desulfosporosinus sp. FKA]|uniref:PH domain-containing protein n=1 Tax=Desulfosporosinus sp. FKA TaxID=1969834 RepID=UPI000B49BB1E|nr:PH domain-containing protein [Desulfosporosinus sp. FKA]
MSYQISIIDVIKAWFQPVNPLTIFITIILLLAIINAGKKVYHDKGTPLFPKSIVTFLILLATPIVLIGSEIGSGWRLKGDELLFKAPLSNSSINLKLSRMALVSNTSEWAPASKTNGVGMPGLDTGEFTLKNGKKAVVFSYLHAGKIVVLQYQDKYYEISYPGAEDLYKELTARGVKVGVE